MGKFIPVDADRWVELVKAAGERDAFLVEIDRLKAEVERWEFIHRLDSLAINKQKEEIDRLKAEVERLEKGIQPAGSNDAVGRAVELLLEKEKEIARLKAEVERLKEGKKSV